MHKNIRHPSLTLGLVLLSVLGVIGIAVATIWVLTSVQKPAVQNTPIVTLKTPVIQANLVASGFQSPTGIAATTDSSDEHLYVVERSGVIRSIVPDNSMAPEVFLDISQKVQASGEMGLLGLAFHRDYSKNGYLFVNYIDKDQNTIIARYHASSGKADTSSEKILFTLKQPYPNHNGGDLAFGPDGYLYAALGDGGSGGDPENHAQDKNSLFGKILRIDINGNSPYAVPSTNPFVADSQAKPEIWAYGLRNPWRISFDKSTGDLYIADVGQGKLEEVNVQKAASKGGENYGWRCYEGNQAYKLAGCPETATYVGPAIEYNHDEERCSITGGYVYRGTKNPALTGKYFYGDFCNGQLFYALNKDGAWTQTLAAKTSYAISTFGQGSDGELYFTDFTTGNLYRLQDTAN